MPLERLLHDAALNALAAAVNQPHLAQSRLVRGVHVLLDDRLDVARREGVEIEGRLDRDVVSHVNSELPRANLPTSRPLRDVGVRRRVYFSASYDAVTTVLMPPRTREVADDGHAARLAGGDEIVEDLVGDRFVEDAAVAELDDVVLERFQLDTAVAGHVGDADFAEVGKPVFGQTRRELGQLIAISKSRPGRGFGNVSIVVVLDMLRKF